MLWSAQSAGKDASDAVGRAAAESLQSLSSQDEDEYYMNPTDPTRVRITLVWIICLGSRVQKADWIFCLGSGYSKGYWLLQLGTWQLQRVNSLYYMPGFRGHMPVLRVQTVTTDAAGAQGSSRESAMQDEMYLT
jgi:hypothetical protein